MTTHRSITKDASPLIETKLQVPRPRPDFLSRPRLLDFLHASLDRKLILISAPAGYGKTTLLADFAQHTDVPVCWYTLGDFDRDFRLFLEYLITAIATCFPDFGERSRAFLQSATDPRRDLQPLVATLVREIYDVVPEYFLLVLDDHHTVEDEAPIREFLDLFVRYVDEHCHLVLVSRTLPTLPNLSLLVARQQAVGLSVDELRFTPQEIQALAQQNYGLALDPEQASQLAKQTGGWITGLLLTAVRRWQDARSDEPQAPLRGHIDVDLYDFLGRQVLDQQPAHLQDFLLASSVLDELSPGLCAKVLGVDDPAALMNEVQARNLFVTEFDAPAPDGMQPAARRLRYHDLFRQFLRTTLRQRDRGRYRTLTRRAAKAYADRGEWEQAVSRHLALGDFERVAAIVEERATDLYAAGRWDTLTRWIDALPEAIRAAHPRFWVQQAKIHAERGEQEAALALLDRAEGAFAAAGDAAGSASALAMKGYVLRFQARYAQAMACCRQAADKVAGETEEERHTLAVAHKNLGLCQFRLGRLAEGQTALQTALDLYEGLGAAYDVGMVYHDLGLGRELAGDLAGAETHYQAALQRWRQLNSPGPWAHTLNNLGVVYHLRGEYEQAAQLLEEALAKAKQFGFSRVEAAAWASLGDLHRDRGAYDLAEQAHTEGLRTADCVGEGFLVTYCLNALGNLARLQGKQAGARQQLQKALEHAQAHDSAYELGLVHVSLGVLAGGEGDPRGGRRHLDQAIARFEAGGFRRDLVRAYLHRAGVAFQAGEHEAALADLEHTLTLAEQLDSDQFLVVEGQRLSPLLRYAAEQGVGGDPLSRLVARIAAHAAQIASRLESASPIEARPALRIYALGLPRAELDGDLVQWPTQQSRDLFFCLLQHPSGLRKEEIGELFWPEHEPSRMHSIFHRTLYRSRRALFRDSVVFEEDVYRFNRDHAYWYDVEVFEQLLHQAQAEQSLAASERIAALKQALDLYQGDYLSGVYADWCAAEQRRLQARYLAGLETLAELHAEENDLQRAIELYQRVLGHDRYRESAHRALMRCYYRCGDRAAAIRQYQTCVDVLREDLGLSPMPETEALYREIIG